MEHQEIRFRLAELDSDEWLEGEDQLTVCEKALLETRLAAYTRNPDTGSTWEEGEGRIRASIKDNDLRQYANKIGISMAQLHMPQ